MQLRIIVKSHMYAIEKCYFPPGYLPVGRDDFNFSSWILLASPHIAPVTERNTLDYMVLVWRVCYTLQKRYPCDRIFPRECKNRFLGFLLLISDLMLAIFTKTSSVTKRNIMDRMDKVVGMAYTPYQCSYSDRNDLHWEKSTKNTCYALLKLMAWNKSSQIARFADLAICCIILHFGVEGSNQRP